VAGYAFQTNDVRVEPGTSDPTGRRAVAASGYSNPLDPHELPQALAAQARAVAEAVASARQRFLPELGKLAGAREVHASATAEVAAAAAELNRAKADHRAALQRAENPAPTRLAVAAAEERGLDAAVWSRNAANRLVEAERAANAAAGTAWLAEVAARRPALEAERARLARAACELLADLARLALAALEFDAVLMGVMPAEALVAPGAAEPEQSGLRIAAAG
jgi:hypothetical protein